MKRGFNVIVVSVLIIIGCAPNLPVPPVAEFRNSNQMFIEKTATNLKLGNILERSLPIKSKIAVVSIENPKTLDIPIVTTIEDQIINQLVVAKFNVLERDETILKYLIEEKTNKNYSVLYKSIVQKDVDKDTIFAKTFETHLSQANYLFSYRILECGLIYRDGTQAKHTAREGLIRLHIRLINTSTGQIVLAGNISGKYYDEIPSSLVNDYEDFHYYYFQNQMPIQSKSWLDYFKKPPKPKTTNNQSMGAL